MQFGENNGVRLPIFYCSGKEMITIGKYKFTIDEEIK
jgi:hypothetical protein